jgi:nitronate monooxygenase
LTTVRLRAVQQSSDDIAPRRHDAHTTTRRDHIDGAASSSGTSSGDDDAGRSHRWLLFVAGGEPGAIAMRATRFTDLVGCRVPVQLAPMGGVGTSDLIRAVVDAGAMGMVTFPLQPPDAVARQLDALADVSPFGVNVLVPLMSDPAVVTIAAERGRLVDFYHASPDPKLVERAKTHGVAVAWQVGSVDDARKAVDVGVDLLVARGIEGGGRLHGGRPLWPLLFDVLDAVGADVPVLAAGGISTGRGLAAALVAGASGVRMGTAFVATEESGAHPRYKAALIAAAGGDTVVTDEFSVMWPEGPRPSRVLRSALEAARQLPDGPVGRVQMGPNVLEVPRLAIPAPSAAFEGQIEAMALYAGDGVGAVQAIEPAATVLARVVAEADRLLAQPAEAGGDG